LQDVIPLSVVPVVLLLVAVVPTGVRESLVLDASEPTLLAVYGSHFLHKTASQLAVNLMGYLLLAGTGYALAAVTGRARTFCWRLSAVVLTLPVLLSVVTLGVVGTRFSYGFSGVVMGLLALLALELFAYVGMTLTTLDTPEDAAIGFFAEVALIAALVRPRTLATVAIAIASGLVTVGYAVSLYGAVSRRDKVLEQRAREPGYVELAGVAVALLVAFPFFAFPERPAAAGGVVNLTTNLLGFTLVFLGAYLRARLADIRRASRRVPRLRR
jgi:hypothetical protein